MRCFFLVSLVALLLAVPTALQSRYSLYPSEVTMLDYQFELRARAGVRVPLSEKPRVMLIGIDAATFRAQAKPVVFWIGDLGKVTQALLDGGAAAVGLDMLLGDVGTEGGLSEPGYAPVKEIMESEEGELIAAVAQEKVVLAQFAVPRTTILVPNPAPGEHSRLRNALASTAGSLGMLGLANVDADRDGVLRAVKFIDYDGKPGANVFGFRLLEVATGKLFKVENGVLKLGDQVIPTENDLAVRLNYPAPPDSKTGTSFPYVSFLDLLARVKAGKPLEGFQDAICIICFSDPSEQDFRSTPFNQMLDRDSLGAETHATLINQVLADRFLTASSPWFWILAPLALALVVAGTAYQLRWYISLPMSIFLIGGYAWFAHFQFAQQGRWLPMVTPLVAGIAAYLISYVSRYDVVKRLFGTMVGAQVSAHMMKMGQARILPGTKRRVTVLFSDINDFTPVTERNTPDSVILMLNDYFAEMCAIVDKYKGNVKQFVGDEIMVIFNAPQNQPDHAALAVRCAMDMIDRLAVLKANSKGKDGFYEVKIGINTGDCVVGNVGSATRMEYAAVGDDVNLGARIESLTKKLGAFLLVSAATKQECEGQLPDVKWISRGVQQFKGKSAEMEVFEVRRK